MELELSSEQRSYHQLVRKFLDTEAPLEAVRRLPEDPKAVGEDFWKQAAELGWASMLVPEELGGGSIGGAPLLDLVIVAEEMGRLVSPGPLIPCNIVAMSLARSGSEQQQEDVLPRIMAGEAIAAWAVADAAGRWEPGAVTVTRTGDEAAVLSGEAHYVEAGDQADYLLVSTRDGDGYSQYLVPTDTAGITIFPTPGLDNARRYASIRFDAVPVNEAEMVGPSGRAEADIARQRNIAVTLLAAETMGILDQVFEMTLAYALDRTAFGRPIGSFQALKHRFADHKTWLEACHGMASALARTLAAGQDDPTRLVAATKALIGDQAVTIVQDCIQMHGGIGVTLEHDLHLYLRRVTLNKTMFGTPQHYRDLLCDLAGLGS